MLREGSVRSGRTGRIRFVTLAMLAAATAFAACASSGPKHFGSYGDLSPRVAPQQGERQPIHLTVQVARPANVAVFLVVPGVGSTLLFPADSTQSEYMEAGSHLVETVAGRQGLSDTARLIRRPGGSANRLPGQTRNGRRDSVPTFGFNQHGYLLIYASQQPLPYNVLKTRVAGLSIPIDDDDALNTVTKLIRSRTETTGPWAAFATEYPP